MPHCSATIVSTGVDTLTCSADKGERGAHLLALAKSLQLAECRKGSKLSPFKRAVYSGVQSSHVAWGEKKDRWLVELRGRWAHDWWNSILPLADKVSRVDLEVTVRQEPYDRDMALRLWRDDREKASQRGRPANFRLIAEAAGGTTLYVGNSASRYQGRLYEANYKHPKEGMEDCWRYEVQSRRERAAQMALLARGCGELQPFVQAAVHRHFAKRGVQPIYDSRTDVEVAPLPERETDKAKSLAWLGQAVAPALERHREWESYEEALIILGVNPPLEHP